MEQFKAQSAPPPKAALAPPQGIRKLYFLTPGNESSPMDAVQQCMRVAEGPVPVSRILKTEGDVKKLKTPSVGSRARLRPEAEIITTIGSEGVL